MTSLRARLTSRASVVGASLLLRLFHRLARLLGALGTKFRPLLALLVNHLLGAQQFNVGNLAAIALAETAFDDARVATVPVAETRANGGEKLVHRIRRHQVRSRQTPSVHVAALAQRDHPVNMRTDRLRLRQRGLNALFHDQGRYQVAQQRAPMFCVPSQLLTCYAMTHDRCSFAISYGLHSFSQRSCRFQTVSSRSEFHLLEPGPGTGIAKCCRRRCCKCSSKREAANWKRVVTTSKCPGSRPVLQRRSRARRSSFPSPIPCSTGSP